MTQMMLNPSSRIGYVALRVHDLKVMRTWYVQMLGLEMLQAGAHQVLLGLQANHRVLVLLEAGGSLATTPTAGLSAFALAVPTWPIVLKQVAWLQAQGVTVSAWFKTGFSRGVRLRDPEGNELILEYDEGPRLVVGHGYNFTNAAGKLASAPRLPAPPKQAPLLPPPTFIGRLVVETPVFEETVDHVQNTLGFILQQKTADWAYLTVGDNTMHFGIEVRHRPLAPRLPELTGTHYVSVIIPNHSMMNLLQLNLQKRGWTDFQYDAKNDYLMIAGPNHLTLWFSIA